MTVSDFDLHAYVDGELAGEERVMVGKAIRASEELSDQVCALQALKQLFRLAYSTAPIPRETQ